MIRAWSVFDDVLYLIREQYFASVNTDGTVTTIGTLQTSGGKCWMDYNGFHICITDGSYGYSYDGETFSQITDFPGGRGMAFLDGFLLSGGRGAVAVNPGEVADTMRCYASNIYDATTWDALSFGAIESNPDELLLVAPYKDSAVMYGEKSIEIWGYNGDGSAFPFNYTPGSAAGYGLAAVGSVCKFSGSLAALLRSGNQLLVGVISGYDVISLMSKQPAVAAEWATYSTVDDAVACSYTIEGCTVYQITFSTANRTWGYEAKTGIWFRMETAGNYFAAIDAIEWKGNVYITDTAGNIHTFEDVAVDGISPVRVALTSDVIRGYSKYQILDKVHIDMQVGDTPFLPEQEGYAPTINISMSPDGGNTFKPAKTLSIGKQGEYTTRVTGRRFGRGKDIVVKVSGSGLGESTPVRYTIMALAEAEIESGNE